MREIVFDTETTGLDPADGHRLCEIGCIELIDRVPTGRTFHHYINPCRDMPAEAFSVHGLSSAFLADKPVFAVVAREFLDFVGDARLVAHNSEFDRRFLNWELRNCGHAEYAADLVVDTLALAKRKFPGAKLSLDALCGRFGIDLSARDKHGALLDAQLLALVYVELLGGRQRGFELGGPATIAVAVPAATVPARKRWPARPHAPNAAELERHRSFVQTLKEAIWHRI